MATKVAAWLRLEPLGVPAEVQRFVLLADLARGLHRAWLGVVVVGIRNVADAALVGRFGSILPPAERSAMASQSGRHPLDRQRNHTEVEAYLVLAQLSYRAGVTRHSPPALGRLREEYDGGDQLSDERAREVMAWTDRRILQAAARHQEWR